MTTIQQNKAQTFLSPYQRPMNVLMAPETVPLTELQALAINRVSFGPFLFIGCLGRLSRLLDGCVVWQTEACFDEDSLSGKDIEPYLDQGRE